MKKITRNVLSQTQSPHPSGPDKVVLQSSLGPEMLYCVPLVFLGDYLYRNLYLLSYMCILILILCTIGVVFYLIYIYISGRRGRRTQPRPWYGEPLPDTVSDNMNLFRARINEHWPLRPNGEDKFPLSRKLGNQHIDNHSKNGQVSYNNFTVENTRCHMTTSDLQTMAAIWRALPPTSGLHIKYEVNNGLICHKGTNNPVLAGPDIIQPVMLYEYHNVT